MSGEPSGALPEMTPTSQMQPCRDRRLRGTCLVSGKSRPAYVAIAFAVRSMRWTASFVVCLLLTIAFVPRAYAAGCDTPGERAVIDGWFGQLDAAWRHQDAAASAALFTPDAEYQEDAFSAPMRGDKAIRAYWIRLAHAQRDVHARHDVLSACGNTGIVHWTASFVRVPSGQKVRLDGIAEVTLDRHGKGALFLEWWNIDQR